MTITIVILNALLLLFWWNLRQGRVAEDSWRKLCPSRHVQKPLDPPDIPDEAYSYALAAYNQQRRAMQGFAYQQLKGLRQQDIAGDAMRRLRQAQDGQPLFVSQIEHDALKNMAARQNTELFGVDIWKDQGDLLFRGKKLNVLGQSALGGFLGPFSPLNPWNL